MATLCRWWQLAPADYWSLRWDERNALVKHMNDEVARNEREKRRRRGRRRRR